MTIFTLTRRRILGNLPHQVIDRIEGYYATKALAEEAINRLFGKWIVKHEEDFFEDYYTSTIIPNVEYYINEVIVITE